MRVFCFRGPSGESARAVGQDVLEVIERQTDAVVEQRTCNCACNSACQREADKAVVFTCIGRHEFVVRDANEMRDDRNTDHVAVSHGSGNNGVPEFVVRDAELNSVGFGLQIAPDARLVIFARVQVPAAPFEHERRGVVTLLLEEHHAGALQVALVAGGEVRHDLRRRAGLDFEVVAAAVRFGREANLRVDAFSVQDDAAVGKTRAIV